MYSVGVKNFKQLSEHFNVEYQTLMAWKKRGSIADYSVFMDKCPTLNKSYLETGEGPMFRDDVRPPTHHTEQVVAAAKITAACTDRIDPGLQLIIQRWPTLTPEQQDDVIRSAITPPQEPEQIKTPALPRVVNG